MNVTLDQIVSITEHQIVLCIDGKTMVYTRRIEPKPFDIDAFERFYDEQ